MIVSLMLPLLRLFRRKTFITYSDGGNQSPHFRVFRDCQPVGVIWKCGAVVIGVLDGNSNCSGGFKCWIIFICGDNLQVTSAHGEQ